ncbi:MAG TPA: DUF433 domain-containing protein [Beijerinckiaceae bacterium]|nr:DUF433 domain-containing protein [Beijerinckiaceae bacterium]
MGKPCIKGTRITVELILRKLGAGRSFAEIVEAYPPIDRGRHPGGAELCGRLSAA